MRLCPLLNVNYYCRKQLTREIIYFSIPHVPLHVLVSNARRDVWTGVRMGWLCAQGSHSEPVLPDPSYTEVADMHVNYVRTNSWFKYYTPGYRLLFICISVS
jgi:hypothetical protein